MPRIKDPGAFGHPAAPISPSAHVRNAAPVRKKSVACPTCGAQIGEGCVTSDGGPMVASGVHKARKTLAIRKYNSENGDGVLRYCYRRRGEQRRATREAMRLTMEQLARLIGCSTATIARYERPLAGRPSGDIGRRYAEWLARVDGVR